MRVCLDRVIICVDPTLLELYNILRLYNILFTIYRILFKFIYNYKIYFVYCFRKAYRELSMSLLNL
jgi:hypothetical protein